MKRGSTLFLKVVICLIAIGVFAAMIWFPRTEGRAKNLDLMEIYLDPFIVYIYVASIPFFIALFQAIKLLGYVDMNKIYTQAAVKTVRNIKRCALAIVGFMIVAIFYIRVMAQGDDASGLQQFGI